METKKANEVNEVNEVNKTNSSEITTRKHVLRALEECRGASISGTQLAAALSISRAAVWKSISQLRADGYCINATTGRGYSLFAQSDVLSPQGIAASLHHRELVPLLHTFEVLESTNLTAKQMAINGAPHGTTVAAAYQTAGRGRLGRHFYSPKDAGIYFSIILRPQSSATAGLHSTADAVLMTTAASVAVARAIEEVCGKEVQIKWVNDLYLEGKKICGILTEGVTSFESGTIESIVIGIGINCFPPEGGLPHEIQNIAGALMDSNCNQCDVKPFAPLNAASNPDFIANASIKPSTHPAFDPDIDPSTHLAFDPDTQTPAIPKHAPFIKNELIASVLDHIMDVQTHPSDPLILEEYKRRSCIIGKEIRIFPVGAGLGSVEDTAPIQLAKAIDIDDRGGLVVEFPDKSRTTLSSGEISIRAL